MKVFDLGCAQGHVFEGWFASEGDYLHQSKAGLLDCPVCADRQITKRLSAPRLNLSRMGDSEGPSDLAPAVKPQTDNAVSTDPSPEAHLQARWLRQMREHLARTEDVGERFAQEARRMHQGESPSRAIRGRVPLDEAVALWEEGIPVLPVPDLPALKHTLQ